MVSSLSQFQDQRQKHEFDQEVIYNNLKLLATCYPNELAVQADGLCLQNCVEGDIPPATSQLLEQVVQNTYKSYQELHRLLWVRIGEMKDSFLGVNAEKVFQRVIGTEGSAPVPENEYETHQKVILVANGQEIEADRKLLAENSRVFNEMLEGKFQEKSQNRILLQEIDPLTLQPFVDFIEGKPLKMNDPNVWIQYAQAADYLGSDAFRKHSCQQIRRLTENLDPIGLKTILDFDKNLFIDIFSMCDWRDIRSLLARVHATIHEIGSNNEIEESMQKELIDTLKEALIMFINRNQVPMWAIAGVRCASELIAWLLSNQSDLRYADFTGLPLTNQDLERLTRCCPNLEYLRLHASITGDALKHIAHLTRLKILDLSGCRKLEPDTLKHTKNLKQLISLNISDCPQLEADALKHIAHHYELLSLNISRCPQLEADALKHIAHHYQLLSLNISRCTQLEAEALKHIANHLQLQSLDVSYCTQLASDTLRYIANPSQLQNLNISRCTQLETDVPKLVASLIQLQSLNISWCKQLEMEVLKYIITLARLKKVILSDNSQVDEAAQKLKTIRPDIEIPGSY